MDTVRKDLKEKIQRMEKIEKEKRKNENILLIITERDFFRQEAIRLNQLCKELSLKLEEMNKEMKIKAQEIDSTRTRWKESEGVNKQLVVELEKSLKVNKDIAQKLKIANKQNMQNTQRANNFNSTGGNFYKPNENKYLNQQENLKVLEKTNNKKNHSMSGFLILNRLDYSEGVSFFFSCCILLMM